MQFVGLSRQQTGLRIDRVLFKQVQELCTTTKLRLGEAVESLIGLVVVALRVFIPAMHDLRYCLHVPAGPRLRIRLLFYFSTNRSQVLPERIAGIRQALLQILVEL
jgi:hypothetical protein